MERVDILITRLLEQYRNKATNEQLRITTQLLLSELQNKEDEDQSFHSVVSVFFPAMSHIAEKDEDIAILTEQQQETGTAYVEPGTGLKMNTEKQNYAFFDPVAEIPTLALKKKEVNDVTMEQESLNDKLKSASQKDVAHNIADGPIKDLRKAIGINDQYLFISELFRNDQTMYERSVKTINSFNVFGEAEFWIKRELKLKLAWDESSEAVKLFDQLIKRRFA
jgi:hypothetical protein